MTGVEIGENVPLRVVGIVHGYVDLVARFVGVLFHGEAVILMEDGFTEFAAVRLDDLDFPSVHWSCVMGDCNKREG